MNPVVNPAVNPLSLSPVPPLSSVLQLQGEFCTVPGRTRERSERGAGPVPANPCWKPPCAKSQWPAAPWLFRKNKQALEFNCSALRRER